MTANAEAPAGDWVDNKETYFWYDRNPFETKYDLEKLTGILLERDPESEDKLVYRGESSIGATNRALELSFEAVLPCAPYVMKPPTDPKAWRNLFLLRVETRAAKKWVTEESFEKSAATALEYWTLRLPCGSQHIAWEDASREFYEQQTKAAIDQ